jgi:hypothetical protein
MDKKIIILIVISLFTLGLKAQDKKDRNIFISPGISTSVYNSKINNSRYFSIGTEISLTKLLSDKNPEVEMLTGPSIWGTAGFNQIIDLNSTILYSEVGAWYYFVNFGMGKNFSTNKNNKDSDFYIFCGLPIPIRVSKAPFYFFEPYIKIRLQGKDSYINNYGLLFKIAFLK